MPSLNPTVHHLPTFSARPKQHRATIRPARPSETGKEAQHIIGYYPVPPGSSTAFGFDVRLTLDSVAAIQVCVNGWKIWSGAASYLRTGSLRLTVRPLLSYFGEFCWHADRIMTLPLSVHPLSPHPLRFPLETRPVELMVHRDLFFLSTSSRVSLVAG